jgi:hypothetical protein
MYIQKANVIAESLGIVYIGFPPKYTAVVPALALRDLPPVTAVCAEEIELRVFTYVLLMLKLPVAVSYIYPPAFCETSNL